MARNNEMTQVMKMLESIQARMDESEKTMELMALHFKISSRRPSIKMVTSLTMKNISKWEYK